MSSKKTKDQSSLINTRNSLEKKVKIKLEKLYETIKSMTLLITKIIIR